MKHFIDHGEFSDNWSENRVEVVYSFSQFIKDIRYWLLPVILLTSVIHCLIIILKGLFRLTMKIPVNISGLIEGRLLRRSPLY